MGRAPCCDKANVKKGPWSPEEDAKLKDFIDKYGPAANWIALPQKAGLKRCGKSCRLRWLNYLRPNIKHGEFSDDEDKIICTLYATIGSRWSIIASQLPGRTDNDIKNYWNTKLKKKLLGIIPSNIQTKFQPPFSFPLQTTSSIPQPHSLSNLNLSHFYSSFYDQPRKSVSSSTASASAPNNSNPQNFLYSNTATHQHEGLADFQGYYPMKDNMLVFGANDAVSASCSSSDGSGSQISYGGGKERVKNEEVGFFQGFIENRNSFEDPLGSILDHHKQRNGVSGNSQLQYDLEEVKQLITGGGGSGGALFLGDEMKGGEMGMYYF